MVSQPSASDTPNSRASDPTPQPSPSAPAKSPAPPAGGPTEAQQRGIIVGLVVVVILVLAGAIAASFYLVNNPATAATVRDVFIIFMAVEALFIGAVLVILMVQLAVLTNLLKNEVKPILEATQETVNTVRGTTLFLSENLTEPVMKLNSYVAGLSKVMETLSTLGGLFRRP